VALVFVFACSIAISAWLYVTAGRLRQTEACATASQRHLTWGNSVAVNQQYAFIYGFRDNITRSASTATLTTGWGRLDADAYTSFKAFSSTTRAVTGGYYYPFNNVRPAPTSDGTVYFAMTTADSDATQTEHFYLYNYFKTYPAPLLGDLFMIHLRPSAATTG